MFLGALIGISILFSGVAAQINYVADNVNDIVKSANIDYNELKNDIVGSVNELSWEDPIGTLQNIIKTDWLQTKFSKHLEKAIGDISSYKIQITLTVRTAVDNVKVCVALFLIFALLGLIGGYFLTKYLIRREIAKRTFLKFILVTLVNSILNATLVVAALWVVALWSPSLFITSFLSMLLFGFISLFEAYIVHGYKKIPLKIILTGKNALLLWTSNLLLFLVSGMLLFIITLITNAFVSIFLAIALSAILFIVIDLNAESYVSDLIKRLEQASIMKNKA
jgi:hypothetical protein